MEAGSVVSTAPGDDPAVAGFVAREDAQECRFAGAVGSDETQAIPGSDLERDVGKERAPANPPGDVIDSEQHGGAG